MASTLQPRHLICHRDIASATKASHLPPKHLICHRGISSGTQASNLPPRHLICHRVNRHRIIRHRGICHLGSHPQACATQPTYPPSRHLMRHRGIHTSMVPSTRLICHRGNKSAAIYRESCYVDNRTTVLVGLRQRTPSSVNSICRQQKTNALCPPPPCHCIERI